MPWQGKTANSNRHLTSRKVLKEKEDLKKKKKNPNRGENKDSLFSSLQLIMMEKSSPTSHYFAVINVCFVLKHQGYKY